MHDLDDAALEFQLRRVMGERLGSIPLELTAEDLERRRSDRDRARRRRRILIPLGVAAAMILPVAWLAAGAQPPRQSDATVVVTTPSLTVSPSASPGTMTLQPIRPSGYQGVFVPTGPLDSSLAGDAYVRLADGRVLGIGDSWRSRKPQALWDPATGQFSSAGLLVGKRSGPIGVLLQDGRVLIVGGDIKPTNENGGGTATYSTAEIYDPVTATFTLAGPMVGKGWAPSAIRLADGRVLVLDGISVDDANGSDPLLATAEVYDPTTDRFTATAPMSVAGGPKAMALLDDGRVLVVGGVWPETGVAQLFDPDTGRFTPTGSLPLVGPHADGGAFWPEVGAAAIRLPDRRVLVPGRHCNETQTAMEGQHPTAAAIFDPATETFSTSTPMPRCVETATSLPDGRVFLTGFWGSTNWSGIYDPSTDTVTETAAPPAGRYMEVVGLTDGGVLVVGGGVAQVYR